ncbi:DNA translocase SpoIIIE [Eubacteriaceae bacterium CHKCI005]|nr:DNA translocase SpoIIIE [Eubacteriaceae bacterium CHKCI005]
MATATTKKKKPPQKKAPAKKTTGAKKSSPPRSAAAKQYEEQRRQHRQAWSVVLFAVALLLIAMLFIPGQSLWAGIRGGLFGLFGVSAYVWPPVLIYIAVIAALDQPIGKIGTKVWQAFTLVGMVCSAIHIFTHAAGAADIGSYFAGLWELFQQGANVSGGGLIGGILGMPLLSLCGSVGAKIVICLLIFVFLMLVTGTTLITLFRWIKKPAKKVRQSAAQSRQYRQEQDDYNGPTAVPFNIDIPVDDPMPEHPVQAEAPPKPKPKKSSKLEKLERLMRGESDQPKAKIKATPAPAPQPEQEEPQGDSAALDDIVNKAASEAKRTSDPAPAPMTPLPTPAASSGAKTPVAPEPEEEPYRYPPTSLLEPSPAVDERNVQSELRANADRLVDTLRSFGVETRIVDISRGPAVTRYELQPSAGVKISKITGLADDIALNLAAAGVRIEAPIPNKPAVGIEVPNKTVHVVHIREILDSPAFQSSRSNLAVALGKDIAGSVALADLGKMPHLLIAGATGSGKSVCINSIILSLLYKSSPDKVRLLMIDPKVVELGVYNGIPHLLVPVVTDPRKAAGALGWAVTEMLGRYKIFADCNVRDLQAYNRLAATREDLRPLPQIVIIIDELADLMMAAPNEVEDSICRLAQMARAAGMHLVIATQRPSVDVITGIIKANIPSRVAFSVSSQVDSRTILDMGGAEKLLGRGDMLFYPVGASKPIRIQGCFVTDTEVESVVQYIKDSGEKTGEYDESIMEEIEKQAAKEKAPKGGGADDGQGDEMLPQAIELVVEAGEASTSMLQRRLRLGYARAGRIMDELEQRGIIGPHEGSKPRKVLMTRQQWMEMSMNRPDDGSDTTD